ncbi:hypothetical protein ACFXGI_16665 [Streptomyces sp. NPDC059355]
MAQHPGQVPQWARPKQVLLEDPAFRRLYPTTDQAPGRDRLIEPCRLRS